MENLKIITDGLIITTLNESMAERVHLNSLDPDNQKYVPDEVFATVEEARGVISFLMECYKGADGPFVYPVLLKSGENIGYVQAVPLGEEWEVGYHIAEYCTRKGYASEALKAFLPVIMKRLEIGQIWGVCRKDNRASCRVLEKCSFELVSCRKGPYHGEEHMVCRYVYHLSE